MVEVNVQQRSPNTEPAYNKLFRSVEHTMNDKQTNHIYEYSYQNTYKHAQVYVHTRHLSSSNDMYVLYMFANHDIKYSSAVVSRDQKKIKSYAGDNAQSVLEAMVMDCVVDQFLAVLSYLCLYFILICL